MMAHGHATGQWPKDLFTTPGERAALAPVVRPAAQVRSWALRVGRDGLSFSTVNELHGAWPAPVVLPRRHSATLAVTVVAGGIALLIAGASAGRAWTSAPAPAPAAAIAVPAPRPVALAAPRPDRTVRSGAARRAQLAAAPATTADPLAASLTRSQAIEAALQTGEFQEWTDRNGVTGYAVAGVAEPQGAATCRALAVLVRQPDGRDGVTSSRACRPTPKTEPTPPETTPAPR